LTQALERDSLKLERISGSHHIFTKPGRRCIPVAFHGGSVSPRYASVVRRQKLDWTVRLQRTKPMIARFAVIADDEACESSVVRNYFFFFFRYCFLYSKNLQVAFTTGLAERTFLHFHLVDGFQHRSSWLIASRTSSSSSSSLSLKDIYSSKTAIRARLRSCGIHHILFRVRHHKQRSSTFRF
jgi:hypothetical protein